MNFGQTTDEAKYRQDDVKLMQHVLMQVRCEIKGENSQSPYTLYRERGNMPLISGREIKVETLAFQHSLYRDCRVVSLVFITRFLGWEGAPVCLVRTETKH